MWSEYADELRLLFLVVLNGIVLAGAWRFARRLSPGDLTVALADTLGLWYLVQYATVGVLGVAGVLNAGTAAGLSIVLAGGLWWGGTRVRAATPEQRLPAPSASQAPTLAFGACLLFLIGYLAAVTYDQRYMPAVTHDSMAYHLPAAVEWMQSGRLGIFEPWFHTPANAYSPLAGSMFLCWMILPLQADLVARFAEEPALVMMFCCLVPVVRRLGLPILAAPVAALAVVMTRPFVCQAVLPKDDVYVAAFFSWGLLGLSRALDREAAAAWRVGAAFGLLLATKYTALFSLPMLLLCADLPRRAGWRWRQLAIVAGGVLMLAGPWYLRNLILTGNPLYPTEVAVGGKVILPGLFQTSRSPDLRTVGGIYEMVFRGYYSPTIALSIVAGLLWVGAGVVRRGEILRNPLLRLAWFGPLIGIAVFLAMSPYAQARFVYPAFVLWFVVACTAVPGRWGWIAAGVMALVSVITAFDTANAWWFALTGMVFAVCVGGISMPRKVQLGGLAAAALVLAGIAFVNWRGYASMCEQLSCDAWEYSYGPIAQGWAAMREQEAAREEPVTVAYTALPQVYALYGPRLDNRVVYVPVSAKITSMRDVIGPRVAWSEEQPARWWVTALNSNVDEQLWLQRLQVSRAQYLFIGKPRLWSLDLDKAEQLLGPEIKMVQRNPGVFRLIMQNEAAEMYQITWPAAARGQ